MDNEQPKTPRDIMEEAVRELDAQLPEEVETKDEVPVHVIPPGHEVPLEQAVREWEEAQKVKTP